MTKAERKAIEELLDLSKDNLTEKFHADAYNIGINVGKAAGQTVFHCHVQSNTAASGRCKESNRWCSWCHT